MSGGKKPFSTDTNDFQSLLFISGFKALSLSGLAYYFQSLLPLSASRWDPGPALLAHGPEGQGGQRREALGGRVAELGTTCFLFCFL
jgi:hypothetical protein